MNAAEKTLNRIDPALAAEICSAIDEQSLLQMCSEMINIPSPTGGEGPMAEYVRAAWQGMGLAVSWQEVEQGRANVIARFEGTGNGRSLMFNGHMDTSNTGDENFLTGIGYKPNAVIKDGMIYGLGIYNMKGALACYTHAVKALRNSRVTLAGDIILAAVSGEIEKSQWEEFRGPEYRGYGVGTHYLVNHGVLPDMCILGEPTDLRVILEHYGSLWVRIAVAGIYVHTAFAAGRDGENSIRRLADVLDAVREWMPVWEEKAAHGGHRGVANLGCIRGGHPWRASRTPERAELFLDLRVPPRMTLQDARREARALFEEIKKRYPGYPLEFETYVSVPGATISAEHQMVAAIERNHRRLLGTEPERGVVLWCSDASVLTRYGIPTVNYGPSSGPRDAQGERVKIKTLVDITKIYALTAAELCAPRLS
ncbi:MAG: M20/M25/M40 family metallo-hydrolase [Acidobacteria bacterium]|nr:M20/M25/M40 family metallo-hydrolase [Acidobacteriota bacterium]